MFGGSDTPLRSDISVSVRGGVTVSRDKDGFAGAKAGSGYVSALRSILYYGYLCWGEHAEAGEERKHYQI